MKIRRRKKIISETERRFSFAVEKKTIRFFCPPCDGQSEMVSINEAARRARCGWREIVRRVEAGEIHSIEIETGAIYVCASSLLDSRDV